MSTTARWSMVGPPSPIVYVVPAFAFPSTLSRRKYGAADSGPFVVTVHVRSCARRSSAMARNRAASAPAPLRSAISAAQTSPAISAPIVAGE